MQVLNRFKLAHILPAILVGMALIVGVGIGVASYQISSGTVTKLTETKLETIAQARSKQIEEYLADLKLDILGFANNPATTDALRDFKTAWSRIDGDHAQQLQDAYIANNPNPAGQKQLLDKSDAGLWYDVMHERNHPYFRKLADERGYYDVFIFDAEGNLIYSVHKESDYATNFAEGGGKWADTDLGKAYRRALNLGPAEVAFYDLSAYAPSDGIPASFISAPIYDKNGLVEGVFAVQIPVDRINDILNERSGLGETGETIMVGEDSLMRNESTFTEETDALKTEINDEIVTQALIGEIGHEVINLHRGQPMFAAAVPAVFEASGWAIVSMQSQEEAFAPLTDMRNALIAMGGILLAIAAALSLLIARLISRPITKLTGTMQEIAEGNFEVEVAGANGKDEIGAMARAVEVFRENGIKVAQMTEEEAERLERNRIERARMMTELQNAFGEVVDAAVAGDFTKRVTAEFPDAELNQLAGSVNNLVETVDRGLGETGQVLAALAQTDLNQRVEGHYQGSFLKLKDDTNAVADKLVEIVGQLRDTS
ncbi:HAMP domain-containing protein, partial [Cucumibacter marinus]|uniref:HAMP domain-containing protein n=1 Tax=Cucumibacter marinus TaxID=1121252 RepID=UPI0006860743